MCHCFIVYVCSLFGLFVMLLNTTWIDNPFTRALASPRAVDDYLAWVNPLWAIHDQQAKVLSVTHHNSDVVSLQLRPSQNWQQSKAGQHVLLGVKINGTRLQRCFSLSSAPLSSNKKTIEITVKRNPDGLVSHYLNDQLRVGDYVWLGKAEGDFVLPNLRPSRLLFIAAGSGITPLMSMLRQLAFEGYRGEIKLLNFTKSEQSLIFKSELNDLSKKLIGLNCVHIYTETKAQYCDEALLRKHLTAPAGYEVFLCGPQTMMDSTVEALKRVGASSIHQERFKLPSLELGDGLVVFNPAGVTAQGDSAGSLLEVAEKAGLAPRYGCRMGVCHECTCKVTGTVKDVRTGDVRSAHNEDIQICVHAAAGGVSVEL